MVDDASIWHRYKDMAPKR